MNSKKVFCYKFYPKILRETVLDTKITTLIMKIKKFIRNFKKVIC